jgi:hypothetical protein
MQELSSRMQGRQAVEFASAVGAAAAGMVSFGGRSAQEAQLQQAKEWVQGKLMVGVWLQFPQDSDLLQQLLARNALVSASMRDGSSLPVVAAAEASLAAKVAAMPPDVRAMYERWQSTEGDLLYFANVSMREGCAFVSGDGRPQKLPRVLVDSACEQPLMDLEVGKQCGFALSDVPPMHLRAANGEPFMVSQQFKGITVVLAMGTKDEASHVLNFWAIPGLAPLADAIYPTTACHRFGSLGLDRFRFVYRYRPRLHSSGDLSEAEVPVTAVKRGAQLHGAAVAAFVPFSSTVGAPTGVWALAGELAGGAAAAGGASCPVLVSSHPGVAELGTVELPCSCSSSSSACGVSAMAAEPASPGLSSSSSSCCSSSCECGVPAVAVAVSGDPSDPTSGPGDLPGPSQLAVVTGGMSVPEWAQQLVAQPGWVWEAPQGMEDGDVAECVHQLWLAVPEGITVNYEFDRCAGQWVVTPEVVLQQQQPRGEPLRPQALGRPWCSGRQWRRAKPRVARPPSVGRRLLMLLVSVLLVFGCQQGVAATPWQQLPAHPPVGGSFRPWS